MPRGFPKSWVKWWRLLFVFLMLGFVGRESSRAGDGRPGPAATSAPVGHGSALEARLTGPAALNDARQQVYPAAIVTDELVLPFVRRVPGDARYDGFDVRGPHLLIENARFTGPLDIFAGLPLVMRRVTVATAARSEWGILSRRTAGPLYLLWSEVGGLSSASPDDASRRLGVALNIASDNSVVYRSHIRRGADGIQVHARGVRIVESVIDGLVHRKGDHNDGVQMLGRAAGLQVLRSRIENPNPLVSCLNLIGEDVRIEGNYLAGGGYTLYGGRNHNGKGPGKTRGVIVMDNVFGRDFFRKSGHFGPFTYWDAAPGTSNIWAGNRYNDGEPIPGP